MTPQQRIEAHVDAAAALIDLPIDARHRAGVVQYFALAAHMAELLDALPLDIDDEPAGAFVPVSPDSVASP